MAAKKLSSHVLAPSTSSGSLDKQAGGGSGGSSTATSMPSPAWVREGAYRFVFEIRAVGKKDPPIKTMEAADHIFSSEAKNWGWQSFAKRYDVYFNNSLAKMYDQVIIACTITYSPANPSPAPSATLQKKMVPSELLDAFSGLFDDPLYSDVKFVIRCAINFSHLLANNTLDFALSLGRVRGGPENRGQDLYTPSRKSYLLEQNVRRPFQAEPILGIRADWLTTGKISPPCSLLDLAKAQL